MNKFERYYRAVGFLEGLMNLPVKKDYLSDKHLDGIYIKRTRYFLNLIGNPDKEMKFIHVAGTSGKGTVTNMVHEIIHTSGQCVGSFTSPYITTSIEKIKVGDKYISPGEFADIVDYLKPHIDAAYVNGPYGIPSYFEIFLAVALVYFKRRNCNWVVLEVGLGGRYDATNVIDKPVITAITNIDFDHTEILGKTLKKIAYDKAGIIKPKSVFFTTEQRPGLLIIFKKICEEMKVPFGNMTCQKSYMEYNRALATMITQYIGITDDSILRGINHAKLMCRFEDISSLCQTREVVVILDGAHNRAKIRSTIDNLNALKYNKLHLIIGIADNKDHISILKRIIPLANYVYFTRFGNLHRNSAQPKDLFRMSKKYMRKDSRLEIFLNAELAINQAIMNSRNGDLILVTGSFFLAGEIRKLWFPEEKILTNRTAFFR